MGKNVRQAHPPDYDRGTVAYSTDIVTIHCDATVKSAGIKMFNNKVGCLIVNNPNGQIIGIVTTRDMVRRAIASTTDIERTPITKIMTPHVISCPTGTSATQAGEMMSENHIRYLPVVEDGTVVGIFSARDLIASLYRQAKRTSLTDALTDVGSRRLLEEKLETEYDRAKRYRRPFSVAMVDLDNFKTINDIFGHATGDEALKSIADCMKRQKRKPDILARYGGDEFVILMPETKAEDAVSLLQRIRANVEQIKVTKDVSMTISCGIAEYLADRDNSASDVLRRADLALYEAKSAGRNCVQLWNSQMSKVLKDGDLDVEKIKKLKRRIAGLSEQAEQMFIQSIWGLVQALEAKSPFAKKHSENVMHYATGIAETMTIAPGQLDILRRAAMIHDIGKIGVPDAILSKPGKLTPRERNIVEEHPLIGVRILEKMSFLEEEIAIVRGHHEKWNGQGYPDGLSSNSIPLGARIMAVADALDALTASRSYHNSRSLNEAVKIIADSSGYDFDPDVVDAMISWIQTIRDRLDEETQLTTEHLLDSQRHRHDSAMSELVAGACESNG